MRAALDWAFAPDGDAALGIALTAAAVTLWVRLSLFAECRERTKNGSRGARRRRRRRPHPHAAPVGARLVADVWRGAARARPVRSSRRPSNWPTGSTTRISGCGRSGDCASTSSTTGNSARPACSPIALRTQRRTRPTRPISCWRDRLMAVALHYLGDQTGARLRIDRINASLPVLVEKPKVFPLDLQDIDAIFPGPHPVASGPGRPGPGARRQKHRGRPRQRPRADLLQRAGTGRLPDRFLGRRFRRRRTPRHARCSSTPSATPSGCAGPVGAGLQRRRDCQAR